MCDDVPMVHPSIPHVNQLVIPSIVQEMTLCLFVNIPTSRPPSQPLHDGN